MLFIKYAVVVTVDIEAVYVVLVAITVVVVPAADVVSDDAAVYPFAAVSTVFTLAASAAFAAAGGGV